jgi:H+/Cl- antiporter ClcA
MAASPVVRLRAQADRHHLMMQRVVWFKGAHGLARQRTQRVKLFQIPTAIGFGGFCQNRQVVDPKNKHIY